MVASRSKSAKKAKKAAKKPTKSKRVNITLDIDELAGLYKRQHGRAGDGDTKGHLSLRRTRADGDTKG
jgi:hypothetical protein